MDSATGRVRSSVIATLLFGVAVYMAACAQKAPPPSPSPDGIVVIDIINKTSEELGVYFIDEKIHTRLGGVAAQRDTTLQVHSNLLLNRRRFRIYAFRGIEACPVGRAIDLNITPRPRVIVAPTDTITSGYLPADMCSKRKQ